MTATQTPTTYTFGDQKQLARFLDRAADRCESVDADPATPKQCWFLAGLILKADDKQGKQDAILNTSLVLTKRRASTWIDAYTKI